MPAPTRAEASATTTATPDVVWTWLRDRPTWPTWAPLGRYEVLEDAGPGQVGTVYRFTTKGIRAVEEVVAWEPGRRFSYRLRSGLPLGDYVATVTVDPFTPLGGSPGARITWAADFRPPLPATGWFWRAFLGILFRQMVDGVARKAAEGPNPNPDPAAG